MRKMMIALLVALLSAASADAAVTYLGVDIQDVSGSSVAITNVNGTSIAVDDNGSTLSIDDGAGSLTIDGNVGITGTPNVNIAGQDGALNVVSTSTVLGAGSASIGTLGANSGTDIGDVTINNAAGASAVNIQDGGNAITVDAVQLDIDSLNDTDDKVAIGDGTDTLAINADGSINATVTSADVTGSTVAAIGPGAGKYERENDMTCSSTNLAFSGLVKSITLAALTNDCVFTINGGDSITIRKNTAEDFPFEYSLTGDADTVTCVSKSAGATCQATIVGSN